MRLYLDTSDNKKTVVRLNDDEFVTSYSSPKDQDVLGAIQQALEKRNKSLQEVTEIEVKTGPGSFTGLRVGVSIANALSLALHIPVNDNEPGIPVVAEYGKEPNIS